MRDVECVQGAWEEANVAIKDRGITEEASRRVKLPKTVFRKRKNIKMASQRSPAHFAFFHKQPRA